LGKIFEIDHENPLHRKKSLKLTTGQTRVWNGPIKLGAWGQMTWGFQTLVYLEHGGAVVECPPHMIKRCGFDSRPSHHLVSLYWSSSCERFVAASWNPRLISVWDRDSNHPKAHVSRSLRPGTCAI
jgi:hypothetical protein